jgi:golgin subfamily B member 1
MVQKLLELELKAGVDGPRASALLLELGDVLCDQGDWDKATATYARSLGRAAETTPRPALASKTFRSTEYVAGAPGPAARQRERRDRCREKGRLLLRASRVARRFAPDEAEGMLARAYARRPHEQASIASLRGLLAEQGRFDVLEQAQQQISRRPRPRTRGRLALIFGTRWVGASSERRRRPAFLEEALKLDPDNEGAFFFLTEAYGKKGGDWDRVLTSPKKPRRAPTTANATFLLAQAGTIAWRQLGNLIRARLRSSD